MKMTDVKHKEARSLTDATIRVRYIDGVSKKPGLISGLFKGAQPLFGGDNWFIIVRIDDTVDRFIPVDNIIEIDVISSTEYTVKESVSLYHG